MRNFIKYSPFCFRELDGYCVPSGPKSKDSRLIDIDILGSKLKILAPKNSPAYKEFENIEPRKKEFNLSGRPFPDSVMPSESWNFEVILARNWAFYGPWFTGAVGALTFGVMGVSLVNHKAGVSFFHPRAFEVAVTSYLTAMYGHQSDGSASVWKGPINWHPISIGSLPAVRLDVYPHAQPSARMHFVFFPVSEEKLVQVQFVRHQYSSGSMEDRDRKISTEPMTRLIDSVVSSISVDLSEDACSKFRQATKDLQDYGVSKDMQPLPWPFDVDCGGLIARDNRNPTEDLLLR